MTPTTKICCEPNIRSKTEFSNINSFLNAVLLFFWLATTRPVFLPEELYNKKYHA